MLLEGTSTGHSWTTFRGLLLTKKAKQLTSNNENHTDPSSNYDAEWVLEALPWLFKIMCLLVIILVVVICLVAPATMATITSFLVIFLGILKAMNG